MPQRAERLHTPPFPGSLLTLPQITPGWEITGLTCNEPEAKKCYCHTIACHTMDLNRFKIWRQAPNLLKVDRHTFYVPAEKPEALQQPQMPSQGQGAFLIFCRCQHQLRQSSRVGASPLTSLPTQLAPGCFVSSCLFPGTSSGWTSVKWWRMPLLKLLTFLCFKWIGEKLTSLWPLVITKKKWCQQTDSEDDCTFLWERT